MNPNKQELRLHIRQCKQAMTKADIARRSRILCELFLQTEAYRHAKTLYGYLPMNQEVQTLPLLQKALSDGKQVALPKCRPDRRMDFVLMEDLSQIGFSSFGAPEPLADEPLGTDPEALVLVPGIVFDTAGHRVGYGGGYYDRFLFREPHHPTIALCYDFQMVARLDTDPHDIPVDTVFWI